MTDKGSVVLALRAVQARRDYINEALGYEFVGEYVNATIPLAEAMEGVVEAARAARANPSSHHHAAALSVALQALASLEQETG